MMNKTEIRHEVAIKISTMADRKQRDLLLRQKLSTLFINNPLWLTGYVMAYMPLDDEPAITEIFCDILRLALPLITATGTMQAREITNIENDLVVGMYGIREPAENTKFIKPEEISLVIVPGRAFTLEGLRLGRGKGFYDRYLTKTSAMKIAPAYQEQIYSDLPCFNHDIIMDLVIPV